MGYGGRTVACLAGVGGRSVGDCGAAGGAEDVFDCPGGNGRQWKVIRDYSRNFKRQLVVDACWLNAR